MIAGAYGIKAENVTETSQAQQAIKNMVESSKYLYSEILVEIFAQK